MLGTERHTVAAPEDAISRHMLRAYTDLRDGEYFGRNFALVVLACVTGSALWYGMEFREKLNDDSYITIAYAKNLMEGRGFVYNHEPASFGTTTPLFCLTIALLGFCLPFLELDLIAVAFSVVCKAGCAWLFFAFRKHMRLEAWQAALVGAVVLLGIEDGAQGMEAWLFQFLLILSMGLTMARQWAWAGLATGLLYLTRGEGGLLFPLILGCILFGDTPTGANAVESKGKSVAAAFGAFALPVSVWSLYAYVTFDSIFPYTLKAKVEQGEWVVGVMRFDRRLPMWLYDAALVWPVERLGIARAFPILLHSIALLGLGNICVKRRGFLLLLAWTLLYTLGYSYLGVLAYPWYRVPLLFTWHIMLGFGIISLLQWICRLPVRSLRARRVGAITVLLLVCAPIMEARGYRLLWHVGDPRAKPLTEAANWLNAHATPEASLAHMDIGYLGYLTSNRIIDLFGLTMPEVARKAADGDRESPFWEYQPDYYLRNDFSNGWVVIESDPRFEEVYEPVEQFVGPSAPYTKFTLFKRRDRLDAPAGGEEKPRVRTASGGL